MKEWTALVSAALCCAPAFGQLQLPTLSTQQLGGPLNQALINPLGGALDAARATTGRAGTGSLGTSALPVPTGLAPIPSGHAGVSGIRPSNDLDRTRIDASGNHQGALSASNRRSTQAMQAFRIGDRIFVAPNLESARAMAGIDQRTGADAGARIGPGRQARARASAQGSMAVEERAGLSVPGARVDQQGTVRADERAGTEISDRTARQAGQTAGARGRGTVGRIQSNASDRTERANDRAADALDRSANRLPLVERATAGVR